MLWLLLTLALVVEPFTMSKPPQKKTHWTSRVNECSVCKDARGDLNVPLRGGAQDGEFAFIGPLSGATVLYNTGRLSEGELLLEVESLSVSGLPLYDVQTVIRNCPGPVRFKTVRPGESPTRISPRFGDFFVFKCSLKGGKGS